MAWSEARHILQHTIGFTTVDVLAVAAAGEVDRASNSAAADATRAVTMRRDMISPVELD